MAARERSALAWSRDSIQPRQSAWRAQDGLRHYGVLRARRWFDQRASVEGWTACVADVRLFEDVELGWYPTRREAAQACERHAAGLAGEGAEACRR